MLHDPLSEFAYAALLVLATHIVPVVRTTIKLAWRSIASPHADIVRIPGSEAIGVLERLLFIYCLASGHREFIGSVLTFKAFSNWLVVQQAPASDTDERHTLLGKFYTYAMGNFISLMFAILFYELVHLWGVRFLPILPLGRF